MPLPTTPLRENSPVALVAGSYAGKSGVVIKVTPKKVHVRINGSESPVCVSQSSVASTASSVGSLGFGSLGIHSSPRSSIRHPPVAPSSPAWQSPGGQRLSFGGQPLGKIVLGTNDETCFLKALLGEANIQIVECALPRTLRDLERILPEQETKFDGRVFSFVASRVFDDGSNFWGGKKKCLRMLYCATSGGGGEAIDVRAVLERVADFASLTSSRKAASRLELLQSPASEDRAFQLEAGDIEEIDEPQPSAESGGCGFIPEAMLCELLGGGVQAKRVTSVQVRLFAPRLGVFKGILARKSGITKVQLPPSMHKVPRSRTCDDDWAWLLITRVHPSKTNLQMAKLFEGDEPCKSFKQTRFSPMIERLLSNLSVPKAVLDEYASGGGSTGSCGRQRPASAEVTEAAEAEAEGVSGVSARRLRKEAWLVGVADPSPSSAIPAGHVFIPALVRLRDGGEVDASLVPSVGAERRLFVTRSPCVESTDARMVPVLTTRPAAMPEAEWRSLCARPFGEILFSNQGERALPESISAGDIDGDLYFVCWDAAINAHVRPRSEEEHEAAAADAAADDAAAAAPPPEAAVGRGGPGGDGGGDWLSRAQEHMIDPSTLCEQLAVGKLYKAGEKFAQKRPLGLDDPDAKACFRAYRRAIDRGKHGGELGLPAHLRDLLKL